jgi:hypothetical protein
LYNTPLFELVECRSTFEKCNQLVFEVVWIWIQVWLFNDYDLRFGRLLTMYVDRRSVCRWCVQGIMELDLVDDISVCLIFLLVFVSLSSFILFDHFLCKQLRIDSLVIGRIFLVLDYSLDFSCDHRTPSHAQIELYEFFWPR